MLDNWIKAVKAHEKLLLSLGVGLFLLKLYGSGLNAWVNHDVRASNIEAQKVQVDVASNKTLADQLASLQVQVANQSATLAKAISDRNTQVVQQQKNDASMTDIELAARWATLIKVTPQEVTTSSVPNTLQVSDNAAHATVDQLETLPACQANLADIQTELASEKGLVSTQSASITGLNGQLVDERASHVADVNTEKVKARRSFLRGFKLGAIAGFIGGLFVHKV